MVLSELLLVERCQDDGRAHPCSVEERRRPVGYEQIALTDRLLDVPVVVVADQDPRVLADHRLDGLRHLIVRQNLQGDRVLFQ